MKKIAFIFMTYDDINNLKIWEDFFAQAYPDQYVIHTHAVNPENITQEFMKKHLVPEHYKTQYAHISQDRALFEILKIAFEDPDVFKAVNFTQGAIPIQSFKKVYEKLTESEKANIHIFNSKSFTSNLGFFHRYPLLKDKSFISEERWAFCSAYGLGFSRPLLQFLFDNDQTDLFDNIPASIEHYIPNMILHYQREDLIDDSEFLRNYHTGGGNHGGMRFISKEFVDSLRKEDRLFLSKLAPNAQIPDMCILEEKNSMLLIKLNNGIEMYVDPEPIWGKTLINDKHTEPFTENAINFFVKPHMNCIEIGANQGYHSLNIAKKCTDGFFWIFEPNPLCVEIIKANLDHNNFNKNTEIITKAVFSNNKNQEFFLDGRTGSGSSLMTFVKQVHHLPTKIEVECCTLDEELENKKIDFMKIDAEGAEYDILLGGQKILALNRPIIIFEWITWSPREMAQGIMNLLHELNYSVYIIKDRLFQIDDLNINWAGSYFDVLAIQDESLAKEYLKFNN